MICSGDSREASPELDFAQRKIRFVYFLHVWIWMMIISLVFAI